MWYTTEFESNHSSIYIEMKQKIEENRLLKCGKEETFNRDKTMNRSKFPCKMVIKENKPKPPPSLSWGRTSLRLPKITFQLIPLQMLTTLPSPSSTILASFSIYTFVVGLLVTWNISRSNATKNSLGTVEV